jgi:hypothetical protein
MRFVFKGLTSNKPRKLHTEWLYGPIFEHENYVEMSGQLNVPAALTLRKELAVPTVYMARWNHSQ